MVSVKLTNLTHRSMLQRHDCKGDPREISTKLHQVRSNQPESLACAEMQVSCAWVDVSQPNRRP